MGLYKLGHLLVESELPLPELVPAAGQHADFRMSLLAARPSAEAGAVWIRYPTPRGGRRTVSYSRHRKGYLLRLAGLADFLVSSDGGEIACYAHTTPVDTIRHLFLDVVVPLALAVRQEVALHAGASRTPLGAVAFLGATGNGKSTLTASFSQAGFPALADDCLVVQVQTGRLVACSSYPGLRLWPDAIAALSIDAPSLGDVVHYSGKRRIMADGSARGNVCELAPLCRIYVLAPEDDGAEGPVRIERFSRREALIELVRHAYRLDVADRAALAGELERLVRVASMCPVQRLVFPQKFEKLSEVRNAILEDLRPAEETEDSEGTG